MRNINLYLFKLENIWSYLDPNTGGPAGYSLQGVLDLHQLPAGAEGGEGEAVPL